MKFTSKTMVTAEGRMPLIQRLSYGVGHVFNDLCAGMWFSYLLLFLQNVLNFSSSMAGYIMLLGQVTDGICTPFIGYESDRTMGFRKYGKRKSWHLVGTVSVVCAFPFLFMPVLGTQKADDWAMFIYYAPIVVIFQFGWAAVQISHLSLIPELTPNESHRVELNAIRYSFLVISNIAVYAVTWLMLGVDEKDHDLGPKDAPTFRNLALIICGLGLLFTIIFHLGVKEKDSKTNLKNLKNQKQGMQWWMWFREPQFYQINFLYMCTRLIFNMSQVYLPIFLISSLHLDKTYIATIPLTVYISGFLMSLYMKFVNKWIGRKLTYLIGALLICGASCWFWFTRQGAEWQLYLASAIMGAGISTVLVTSLAMVADLIGDRTESGAFVYGCVSFTDKLSNGAGIFLLQHYYPCKTAVCCEACVSYYRNIIVILPGTVAGLALLTLATLVPVTIGKLNRKTDITDQASPEAPDKECPHILDERIEHVDKYDGQINQMDESTYM